MRVLYLWGLMALLLSSMLLAAPLAREVKETKVADFDLATLTNSHLKIPQSILLMILYPSSDYRHFFYRKTEGEKSYLVRDGVAGASHDEVIFLSTPFTPDYHFYCWLRDGEQWTMLFDNKEYHVAAPAMLTPFVSPDGKHIAYIARRGKDERCVLLDGVEGNWYGFNILAPVFSSDSQHLAYGARTKQGHWVLVVDGKEIPGEEDAIVISTTFSPDSQHCAVVLRVKGQYCVQIDGVRGKAYDCIEQFSYTALGKPRFMAKTGNRWALITGDEERELPGYAGGLVISDDGKHLAYLSGPPLQTAVVTDGITGPTYKIIERGTLAINCDGHSRYLALTAKDSVAVIDGKETAMGKYFSSPIISPDGKRQARQEIIDYQVKIVTDGVDGTLYNCVSTPVFSPDSRHLAYFADQGDRTMLVIDGQEGKGYEALIAPRLNSLHRKLFQILSGGADLFVNDHQVRYLVYQDKAIYCVEETLK